MDNAKKDTLYRLIGILGLVLLFLATFLARSGKTDSISGRMHDHSSPGQHGHDLSAKPLESKQEHLVPSGILRDGTRIVQYEAFQYGFSPDPLIVRSGETVVLTLKSRDVTHGMMIPEIDFNTDIPAGKEKEVSFKAPGKPGQYPIFCSVFCGSEHGGMKGTLLVLDSGDEKHE